MKVEVTLCSNEALYRRSHIAVKDIDFYVTTLVQGSTYSWSTAAPGYISDVSLEAVEPWA